MFTTRIMRSNSELSSGGNAWTIWVQWPAKQHKCWSKYPHPPQVQAVSVRSLLPQGRRAEQDHGRQGQGGVFTTFNSIRTLSRSFRWNRKYWKRLRMGVSSIDWACSGQNLSKSRLTVDIYILKFPIFRNIKKHRKRCPTIVRSRSGSQSAPSTHSSSHLVRVISIIFLS